MTAEKRPIGVHATQVTRIFAGGVQALAGVDLNIDPGTFVSILGPSGCGKSTFLRIIAGLDEPTGGSVELSGKREQGALAYVFQDAHLLPWRTVIDNVALPLELHGISTEKRRSLALTALGEVGLGDALDRFPNELSGGMRMRASLARAVVTRPALLLLDEPFAALDEITRQRLNDQLRKLQLSLGMTVIFVTHSIAEAAYLSDRAVVFSSRPGRIVLDRSIDLPTEREMTIRTTPEFARELAPLQQSLAHADTSLG